MQGNWPLGRGLLNDQPYPPPSTLVASTKIGTKSKSGKGTKQITQGIIALVLIDVKGKRLSSMIRCAKKEKTKIFETNDR